MKKPNGPSHNTNHRYPNASFLADNIVIFNIKENAYRLAVKARYENEIMLIE
jgi:mRNA interferase HigB